jgi:hypothetical protein
LRAAIVRGGWYDYFDQVNISGALGTPDAIVGHLIAAK